MQILTFPNEREYVKAQQRADEAKSKRLSVSDREVACIRDYFFDEDQGLFNECDFQARSMSGICHGVRNGEEVDKLAARINCYITNRGKPFCEVIGTDLFIREHHYVQQWDFRKPFEHWIDKFDFVYSNSLDHSDEPEQTLRVWHDQLSQDGVLLLQWSTAHRYALGADCFGASLDEYLILVSKVFNVRDLLWIGDDCCKVIIIGERKST